MEEHERVAKVLAYLPDGITAVPGQRVVDSPVIVHIAASQDTGPAHREVRVA